MLKTVSSLLLLFMVYTDCWSQTQEKHFHIEGNLVGFSDSTMLYLDDATSSSPVHIDSTFIINNRFKFSGSVHRNTMQAIIRTANFEDYKFFWLENAAITFRAEKERFREAEITGSKTQMEDDSLSAAIKHSGNEQQSSIAFINSHLSSIVSAYVLSVYASSWGRDTAAMLFNKFPASVKSTSYGKKIEHFIMLNKDVQVGDKYTDFTEQNISGKNISLSDYNGKVVLLEFWGTWCGPCREGNPELVKIYNDFKNKGFNILGVAADSDKDYWMKAVKQDGLIWENVTDLKGDQNKAALIYGVSYYPSNYLINKEGVIIAKDLQGDALRAKLTEVLQYISGFNV